MNYGEAIAQLRDEHEIDYWEARYPDEPTENFVIAKEVGGALAEGFGNRISFDTFDNCREWGLTFTAGGWTFCCYEHRNSDEIHIEGRPTVPIQEWGPYGGDDKYDTMFHAGWEQYQTITKALTYVIEAALIREINNRADAIGMMNLTILETA